MKELYVVIDVGCLECEMGTSVLGAFPDELEARSVAEARIRENGEDGELDEVPTHPSQREPASPETAIALRKCYSGQSSVEIHRVSG